MIFPALLLAACLPLRGDGDQITAADLAAGEPAFGQIPPQTTLGPAPLPGARRVFTVTELQRMAEHYGLSASPQRPVCLERTVAPLDPARLLEAMQTALGVPDARIEIVEYSRFPAPQGAMEFARGDLGTPPPGRAQTAVLWKGSVRYGGGRRFSIWARVRILWRVECIVATQTLVAGRAIEPGRLRRAAYTGFPVTGELLQTVGQAAGRVPRRAIAAGTPVPLEMLDPPYDVERGATVAVEVASGEAVLKLEARAEADGRVGQIIPLVNPASGRRFNARVAGPGKVVAGVHP